MRAAIIEVTVSRIGYKKLGADEKEVGVWACKKKNEREILKKKRKRESQVKIATHL